MPNHIDEHVGGRVRLLREEREISIDFVAAYLDIEVERMRLCEKGERRLSADMLFKIAAFLGVDVKEFFVGLIDQGGDDPNLPDPAKPRPKPHLRIVH